MMWASLLLAGILSGWWGALAIASAPPANSVIARIISPRDVVDTGTSQTHGQTSRHPSDRQDVQSSTTMTTTRLQTSGNSDLPVTESSTSVSTHSDVITTNLDIFRRKTTNPNDNWNDQSRKYIRQDGQTQIDRSNLPIGYETTDFRGEQGGSGKNQGSYSIGPLLENLIGYQVTPISVGQFGHDEINAERMFSSTSEFDTSDAMTNEDTSFEDLTELQDYEMDDDERPRESRKFDSSSEAGDSIYPSLGLAPSSSSSSSSTATMWAEIIGPKAGESGDRSRVSRSTKQQQQRAKNRTRADSPREQRRKCRNKGCRGRNWCPDMDIGNRAFLAPTVFEGKARSMSSVRKPGSNYAVTFEVKQVYKSQPSFQPLQKNDSVRLHFRDKSAPGKSTLCDNNVNGNGDEAMQQRDNPVGLVRANIKRGKVYLVFVNRVGPRNFTILGEPVVRSKKNEQAVQAVIRPDYVRQVTLSDLRDSVARLRDRVKLVCRTRGSPPPRVHWLKDGVPLHPRRGLRIQHKRRRSKVVIASARQEDSGRYECVAESTSGHRASLTAQLLVAHDTRIQDTTTAAWPRQEQPCPIAGDFCMNGGTCLFFETVGEPACRCAEGFTGLRCETKDVISTGSVYNRHRAPFSCKLGLSTSYYC